MCIFIYIEWYHICYSLYHGILIFWSCEYLSFVVKLLSASKFYKRCLYPHRISCIGKSSSKKTFKTLLIHVTLLFCSVKLYYYIYHIINLICHSYIHVIYKIHVPQIPWGWKLNVKNMCSQVAYYGLLLCF